ncbi:MAG: serine/threonine-protein kinase [Anaerolineales bacterium]
MTETAASPLSDFRPGGLFRHYQLLEQIGTGGQGVVWSARDPHEGRIVAIKFSEAGDSDQERVYNEMLALQTERLTQLRHPYILPLYEIGLTGQIRYFVSRYASGGTLYQKIASGPLEAHQALRYASEIAAALTYLHQQGVIHRDLKSSNVLTDLSHNAYLSDFGIARFLSASTQALHTGRGTPAYAPPEQHRMAAISPQSDLYSFGILLYELFTGHLPWDGENALGIRQLYSADELPDPRDLNPALPPALTSVLRRLTAAEAADRPASAEEAVRLVYQAFGLPPAEATVSPRSEDDILRQDVQELIRHSLPRWEADTRPSLSLTKFALVSEYYRRGPNIPDRLLAFLLYHALIFGFEDQLWWERLASPERRLAVAGEILNRGGARSVGLALTRLRREHGLQLPPASLPPVLVDALLNLAGEAEDPVRRQEALSLLETLTSPPPAWQPRAFGEAEDRRLTQLALEDSETGDQAARLIGCLRSEAALREALDAEDGERRAVVLEIIHAAAGSLPRWVAAATRHRLLVTWLLDRLFARPLNLLAVYAVIFLGGLLGFGLQAYLTARVPHFWEARHIILSLERGAIFSAPFAFGVLATRLVMERFGRLSRPTRLGLATLLGSLLLYFAAFVYDALVLNAAPAGGLVPAACLLIALGFSASSLLRRRPARILLSGSVFFLALAGSWWAHLHLGQASPLLFYDYAWPPAFILGTMLLVTSPIALFGHLLPLAAPEE